MRSCEDERGTALLAIARESLAEALGLGQATLRDEPWLFEPGATFVTLTQKDLLRGCVGSVRAYRPVLEDVRANARAAAFHDTRFAPVTAPEFPLVQIEVSLLSPLEPLTVHSEEQVALLLRPGIDGVFLEYGPHRGTFLPQVWKQLVSPEPFLRDLKRKAGLAADFWSPDIRLWRYTVEKWEEESGV